MGHVGLAMSAGRAFHSADARHCPAKKKMFWRQRPAENTNLAGGDRTPGRLPWRKAPRTG